MMQELRLRNLAKSKAYRDSVALWGEPTKVIRKRVIIAPSMITTAGGRDVTTINTDTIKFPTITKEPVKSSVESVKSNAEPVKSSVEAEDTKFSSYKNWIEERKILRKEFDKCAEKKLVIDWPIPVKSWESQGVKESIKDGGQFIHGNRDPSNKPSINQPLPQMTLAKIHKFLNEKRMRMYDLFVQADRDKDWKITCKEFQQVLQKVGVSVSNVEVEHFISALDQNRDDALEYKELAHGLSLFIVNDRERVHYSTDNESDKSVLQTDQDEEETEVKLDQLTRQNSSLLSLPDTSNTEFMANVKEKHLKRQKRKEKHRNRVKSTEEVQRQPCTMGGVTGSMVDRFQERNRREYEKILELCHLHGIKLSRNMLERVLLHPEDRSLGVCVTSISPPSKHPPRQKVSRRLEVPPPPTLGKSSSKAPRRKSIFYTDVYPPAAAVRPRKETMSLSSGSAGISRKTDCWMTYEEYSQLTRHLESRFEKSWKPSDTNAYWPSYVSDKVRLYLDQPRTKAQGANSIFDIVHNRTIH